MENGISRKSVHLAAWELKAGFCGVGGRYAGDLPCIQWLGFVTPAIQMKWDHIYPSLPIAKVYTMRQSASELILLTCAFPKESEALEVARILITRRLAAAVHVSATSSHFIWNDIFTEVQEYVLNAKTTEAAVGKIVDAIKEHHSYELPGISYVLIAGGAKDYLDWIAASVCA